MKTLNLFRELRKWTAILVIPTFFAACNTATSSLGDDDGGQQDSSTVDYFPQSLAVASPVDYTTQSGSSNLTTSGARFVTSSSTTPYYLWATGVIDQVLEGTATASCTFDPSLFLTTVVNADCFGPQIAYEDHPDGSAGSGTLPTGDVGMWLDEDPTTSEACSAAQLNARMEGMRDRTLAGMTALATMVCAANTSSLNMPSSTAPGTLDVLSAMTSLGISGVTFTKAEITYDSSTTSYISELDFTYDDGSDTHDIVVDMEHVPSSTVGAYAGTMSMLVDDEFTGGNCPTNDVTRNISLQYDRASVNDIAVEVREGSFCENGSDGRDVNNLIDPSDKYTGSNPTGWGNDFSIFTANYDAQTLDGDYSFAWQAGPQDSNARIFNMNVSSSGASAIAFYGYGADIDSTSGEIQGFICNWAGPGANHTLVEYAQSQELSVNTSTGAITTDVSNIIYAPTVSCEYDGTSTFVFDTNLDGLTSDEDASASILEADNTMELVPGDDLDSDGNDTIEEVIEDSGFTLPTI